MSFTGFLNIHKPVGLTSRAVVDRVGFRLRKTKLGHCGTLDPLASGVLVLALGQATRLTEQIQDLPKTYDAVFRLGATSATDDGEGPVTELPSALPPTPEAVAAALGRFIGPLLQTPPTMSAVRLAGVHAYDLARQGQPPALAPRPVVVHRLELLRYAWPELEVRIDCGKGTYVRSLARDLGLALGCGGHVARLVRTRIGDFRLADSLAPDASKAEMIYRTVPVLEALAHLRKLELSGDLGHRLRHGIPIPLTPAIEAAGSPLLFVVPPGATLILAKIDPERRCLKAERSLRLS